jgi:hypothetical protein
MARDRRYLPLSRRGFAFPPFHVPDEGVPLSGLDLDPGLELISFRRAGAARVLVARELAFHHVAQGELRGQPYIVSF